MPSYLGGQSSFRDNYEIPIMKYSNRKATEDLKKRINPFKLRRLKAQVAAELPEKIYMDRACELFAENLRRLGKGERLLNLVDRALGY